MGSSFVSELQDLVLKHEDVGAFMEDLAKLSADALELEALIGCSVTLRHRDATFTVASSTLDVVPMDEVQYELDEGPCLGAIGSGATVIIDDFRLEDRWPEYRQRVERFGVEALIAVPLSVGPDGGAVLGFYARSPRVFTAPQQRLAEVLAAQASRALQMTLRITSGSRRVAVLKGAMESRTAIDIAVGIIMSDNRCTKEQSLSILKRAAEDQNTPLRAIAERICSSISGDAPNTYFTS